MEWMRTGLPDWYRGTTWCVPHILELPADGGAQCAEGRWSLLSCCGQSLWCLLIADKDIRVISSTQTVNTHETTDSCRHNKEFTSSTHPFSAPPLSWSNGFIIHEDVEAECKVISSLSVTREDWRPLELSPILFCLLALLHRLRSQTFTPGSIWSFQYSVDLHFCLHVWREQKQ